MRVASSDWCASRMRGVGQQHALLRRASTARSPRRPAPRASACVPGAGAAPAGPGGSVGGREGRRPRAALASPRMPLTMVVADEASRMRLARSRLRCQPEQLRRLVDEARGVVAAGEARMGDQLVEEPQVRHHAADAEFPQRAVHARDGLLRRRRPGRHLHQQRVVGARDDRAGVGGAGIQAHAEAGRTAVGGDRAVVGHEVVLRVLGGDAALQRVGVDADVGLRRHAAGSGVADARAAGDADLRLDDVDAGDALGDRVLDLDARVDLDEVELAGCRRPAGTRPCRRCGSRPRGRSPAPPRTAAARWASSRNTAGARSTTFWLRRCTVQSRSNRCTSVAVLVAEDLHLDVARAAHQLLEVHLVVAEGRLRLAPRHRQQLAQLRLVARSRACRGRRRPSWPCSITG